MSDPWNRFSSWQSSGNLFANDEPSGISPRSSGGILGNFGQLTERHPAAQFLPDNAPWAPTASTWAQWPGRSSVETYDPEALKFAAAWRRMHLTPWPPVFAPTSDLPQSYSQPSNNPEKPEFLSSIAHDGDWSRGAELNGFHDSAPAVVPASYQTGARPWWAPVPSPDVFNPWREHALKGLLGLYKFFSDSGPYPSGGNRNGPGCKEEWEAAREKCADWLSSPNPPRHLTGGYRNVEDCARGLVSERCGGNPIDQ